MKISTRKFLYLQAKKEYRNSYYDEMARSIQHLASLKIDLSERERLLMSQVVRKTIRMRRDRIRQLQAEQKKCFEQEEQEDSNQSGDGLENVVGKKLNSINAKLKELKSVTRIYRNAIERLLFSIVDDLIPNAIDLENQVYLLKTKADLHSYLAELAKGKVREMFIESAKNDYKQASEIALDNLDPTNSTRISLMLNHAVFHYELLGLPRKAIGIANSTFNYVENAEEHADFLGNVYLGILNKHRSNWMVELHEDPLKCDYDDPLYNLLNVSPDEDESKLELAAYETVDALRLHFPGATINSIRRITQKVLKEKAARNLANASANA